MSRVDNLNQGAYDWCGNPLGREREHRFCLHLLLDSLVLLTLGVDLQFNPQWSLKMLISMLEYFIRSISLIISRLF